MAEKELQALHDTVYDQALIWVNSLKAEQKDRILGHFGPMPVKDSEPQVHSRKLDILLLTLSEKFHTQNKTENSSPDTD